MRIRFQEKLDAEALQAVIKRDGEPMLQALKALSPVLAGLPSLRARAMVLGWFVWDIDQDLAMQIYDIARRLAHSEPAQPESDE